MLTEMARMRINAVAATLICVRRRRRRRVTRK